MLVRVTFLSMLILCCSVSVGEEVVEIPLSEVWAYEMPGTKNISKLSSQEPGFGEVIVLLRKPAPQEESAKPTFAVQGTGRVALRNSYEVLVNENDPKPNFDTNKEISIVFFSHDDNHYVHLQSVELKNKTITLNCNMITHETQETTYHFALIPIGKLSSGKYHVDVVVSQVDSTGQPKVYPVEKEIVNRIISGSSTFSIKEGK